MPRDSRDLATSKKAKQKISKKKRFLDFEFFLFNFLFPSLFFTNPSPHPSPHLRGARGLDRDFFKIIQVNFFH
jgi:hypothetical protein